MAFIPSQAAWDSLIVLSEKSMTMTELAKKTKKSLPYTLNIVKLLVAFGLVIEEDTASGKPGKPAKLLRLVKTTASLRLAGPGTQADKDYTPSAHQALLLGLAGLKPTTGQALAKFIYHSDLIEHCDRICILKEAPKIELVLITDDVEHVRKKYSSAKFDISDAPVEIACWTHSKDEIAEGVSKEDPYFMLMNKAQTLFQR
jgi:hypothetical protein